MLAAASAAAALSSNKKLINNAKYDELMRTVQILVIILVIAFAIVVIVVGLGGLEVLFGKPMPIITALNTISSDLGLLLYPWN